MELSEISLPYFVAFITFYLLTVIEALICVVAQSHY